MIKVTIEFKSVDETIVALGKLVGAPVALKAPVAAAVSKGAEIPLTVPVAPTIQPKERKGRADKGQPRGPRKNAIAVVQAEKSAPQTAPVVAVMAPGAVAPASSPAEAHKAHPSGQQTESPAAAAPSEDDAKRANQAMIEKIYMARGAEIAMQFLSRFGVKRVRELLPKQYAEFVKHGETVAEGGAV